MSMSDFSLPPGIEIFERGWLSANNIFLFSDHKAALVDTGYCTHQYLTVELVKNALLQQGLPTLNQIVNTHLHSDHCGGNAALSKIYHPEIFIPGAEASAVQAWNEDLLSYRNLGQECPRFVHTHVLIPGKEIVLGLYPWKILAAPGHDPYSVMLYQADHRILISADALWEDGFGVIFPELWGHGKSFTDVATALKVARSRLDYLVSDPDRNARHGAKVLLKYKLLEWRSIEIQRLTQWIINTPALTHAARQLNLTIDEMASWLPQALVKANAARIEGQHLVNVD